MTPTEKDEFLDTARKRFSAAAEDEKHLRDKFISDLRFASPDGDDQWDPKVKTQREAAGRPAMSFPRCHIYVQQVSNEARQNKPQVKFAPRLDADKDTAEIYEGLARYIQYASDAQVAYETAIEYSAGGSFGYYRFLTDYCDEDSDDLDLKVVPVRDPLAVYGILVPACFGIEPDSAFVVQDIPKDEYKAKYGESEMASLSWEEAGREAEGWVGTDTVRIAEYWYVKETKVEGKRKPQRKVKFCKINGIEILEGSETDWAGSTIPIIPVLGKQMIMEGKPRLYSVVRPQKGAQQLINYTKSRIAETLAQAPVSPFMGVEGQFDGYEDQWATLNSVPRPFLTYKAIDVAGRPAERPQRDVYEPPIQALSSFALQEIDDMKATTGIFDASLGNQGNETSGKAIFQRQQQSNLATMHFMDNLERSFKQAGNVIAELIPKIYDTAREIAILGEDEATKVVKINQEHKDKAGKPQHYDMTAGKYDVVVTMGRSFSSKRQESFDMMTGILQTSPNLLPMIGDILFRNSDTAGADQMADRLHKMLPPNLQEDEKNPLPPEAQAHVAQAQQQMQMMQGEMQKLQFEKAAKTAEHQGKMQQIQLQGQQDQQLEMMKLENALAIAEVETKAQSVNERLAAVEDMFKQFHINSHELAMQKDAQVHQQGMAQQAAQQQSQLADQQAQNTSAQSAQDAAQGQAAAEAQPSAE